MLQEHVGDLVAARVHDQPLDLPYLVVGCTDGQVAAYVCRAGWDVVDGGLLRGFRFVPATGLPYHGPGHKSPVPLVRGVVWLPVPGGVEVPHALSLLGGPEPLELGYGADFTLSVVNNQVEVLRRTFIAEMTNDTHNRPGGDFPESLLRNDWLGGSAQSILALLEGPPSALFPTSVSAALYFYATVAEIFSSKTLNNKCFLRGYRLKGTGWIDRLAQARNMISTNGDIAWELVSHFRDACGMHVISKPGPQP